MKKLINSLVSLVIILAVAAAAHEAYFKQPAVGAPGEKIVIAEGMKTPEVAALLKKAGVISSSAIFTAIADLSGKFKDLHAGTFIMKEGMSVVDALKTLSVKGSQEISVTIPEGFDLRQIAERLVAAGIVKTTDEFYAVTGAPGQKAKIADSLAKGRAFVSDKPADATLEGYLFPDTYRFFAGATAETVVEKMLDAYGNKINDLRNSPTHADLTVASLVEAEVRTEADRAKVADILKRRLNAGMPLQLDSTVNYITGKSAPSVSSEDQRVDSPYNTYKYKGLPPGPICDPGLASINAALAPTPNSYWYFLTTADGTVIYSKTLDEHNAAKAKYLK